MKLRKKMASLIFALLVCSKLLILLMARYGFLPFSPGIFIMGLIAVLIVVYMMLYYSKLNKRMAAFIVYVLVFFIATNLYTKGHINEVTISFFQYCLVGLLVSQIDFDIEVTSRIVSYIFLVVAYPSFLLIQKDITQTWQAVVTMEICYALLPVLAMAIIRIVYFRNNRNICTIFSSVISLYFLLRIFLKGTRGVLACLLVLIVLMFLNTDKRRVQQIKISRIILILIGIVLFVNIDFVLMQLSNLTNSMGISINILDKSARLLAAGDMSNGRTEHYVIAIRDFLESPIWGNGIGVFFDRYPEMGYPHNIICQVLFEGGILLGAPIILLIVKGFNSVFFNFINERESRIIIIYLFSISVPAAMLSSELWVYPLLWQMFGYLIIGRYTYCDNKQEKLIESSY